MVVNTNHFILSFVWVVICIYPRLSGCSFYLRNILMKSILGISAFYHDSAATIIIDGKIIAAAQEERFTRIKHDKSYPFHAIEFVLRYSKLKLSEIDLNLFVRLCLFG